VFRFETYGRNAVEERLLALEGEKNRRVIVHFGEHTGARERDSLGEREPSRPSPGLAVHSRGVPASVLVFGAIGGAGIGAFAGFGLWGMAAKKDLDAQGCKPNCPEQDVDRARVRFLAADIGLGVGAVSLGLATWFWFSRNDGTAPGKTAAIRLEPLGWNGVALRGAF
jgi:hypothetical protein